MSTKEVLRASSDFSDIISIADRSLRKAAPNGGAHSRIGVDVRLAELAKEWRSAATAEADARATFDTFSFQSERARNLLWGAMMQARNWAKEARKRYFDTLNTFNNIQRSLTTSTRSQQAGSTTAQTLEDMDLANYVAQTLSAKSADVLGDDAFVAGKRSNVAKPLPAGSNDNRSTQVLKR